MKKNILYFVSILALSFLLLLRGNPSDSLCYETDWGFLIQYAGEQEEDVYSQVFILNKGTYHFTINYTASESGNDVIIRNYGIERERISLDKEQSTLSFAVTLEEPSSQYEIAVHYNGVGYLEIKDMTLEADQPWYHDNWLNIVGLWILAILIWITLWKLDHHRITKKDAIEIWAVIGTALSASVFFMSGNMVGHGDDLNYHLTRIEGIAQGLRSGQFPVMIYPDIPKGNGYLNALYPSLFLYIPAVLRLLGVSLVTAYKLFLGMINFASAFSMYVAMKNMTKSRKAVILATVMYVFLFYRLNNMLMRAALGEALAMVFLPLILAGLYQILFGDRKKWWLLTIGATGVIQSHVLSTVMYAAIAVIIVVVFIKETVKERRYCELGKAIGMTVLLNLWFVVPFIAYYLNGNLNLKQLQIDDFWKVSLNPSHLFGFFMIFKNEEFMRDYSLHLPVICLLGISILYLVTHRKENRREQIFYKSLFAIAALFLFMASNLFPYEALKDIQVFYNIFAFLQFPWRFVGPAATIIIMVGSIWLDNFTQIKKYVPTIVIVLIAIPLLDISSWNLPWNSYINEGSAEADDRTALQDKVCENIIYCVPEYTIKGNGEYLDHYRLSDDNIVIGQYVKDKTSVYVEYISNQEDSWIDLPLQNYLGYQAVDEEGNDYTVRTGDNGNIRVVLHSDGKSHTIDVCYKESIWFRFAELISLLTVIGCIGILMNQSRLRRIRVKQ